MRYEILIYNNAECEAAIMGGYREELDRTHAAVIAELRASGELVATDELSAEVAVVVRTDADAPHRLRRTDGPFSEAKEWVGGFYLVDCETLDRAVEIAGRFIESRWSPVEVRQLVHFTG
jgi:hypothetical protein